ncbi:MAG: four-carbon acid sugar kinase family protein [Staphylococcus sp.]|nr:four-carbon acid sugar kinase family protein [Staphylococcus sp.]
MIAVIADDITGAAEMAGIAHRLGLRVSLTMHPDAPGGDCDVLVVATDTRSMSEEVARGESAAVARALDANPAVSHIFKKTDSALRGHVVAELEAILAETTYSRVLYLPANPSKGRTISGGVYYISGTPLSETDFSFDPEFPALTSALGERFAGCRDKGIDYADAETAGDISRLVEATPADTLLAGAADLFTAFLGKYAPATTSTTPSGFSLSTDDSIVVCGSTQSKAIDCGITAYPMPTTLYDGLTTPDGWIAELSDAYRREGALIIGMSDRHRTGKESAVYLRETMATVVAALCGGVRPPRELVIEGGATAFAILRRLGWDTFVITDEIAPGVIRMRSSSGTGVTMKPGSYPWGGLF